jgi:hypothetical protein
MASTWYDNGRAYAIGGSLNWTADTIQVLLVGNGYTPSAAHQYVSDVVGQELSTTGYVRKTLATKSVLNDTGNHRADLKADNLTWTAIGTATTPPVAAYAIVFKFITNDAASVLLGCIDNPDQALNGGDFTLKWDSQASNGAVLRVT